MVTLTTLGTGLLLLSIAGAAATRPTQKEVLAFYYGWYGNPQISGRWVHWQNVDEAQHRISSTAHFPALGAYDSHDPGIIAKHVREARQAGITGFIVSWWAQWDFHDQGMPLMLAAAAKANLKVTVYFETVKPRGAASIDRAVEDVLYILERYGNHPAWLKVNGKPVLFIYGRAISEIKLAGWSGVVRQVNDRYRPGAVFIGDQISAEAAKVFDGIHTYNPTGKTAHKSLPEIRQWAAETFPTWVAIAGDKIACVTIIPGYDDTSQNRPAPRPITDRHDGATYRVLWRAAIDARPDWVLITSWNEWHEGSEIEPSLENGNRELKTTQDFAPGFARDSSASHTPSKSTK